MRKRKGRGQGGGVKEGGVARVHAGGGSVKEDYGAEKAWPMRTGTESRIRKVPGANARREGAGRARQAQQGACAQGRSASVGEP